MGRIWNSVAAGLALLALVACAGPDHAKSARHKDYVEDAAQRLRGVDWAKAKIVRIRLDEYAFAPETMIFKAGRAYRLRIENGGGRQHNFSATGFFRAIAVDRVAGSGGVDRGRFWRKVTVDPGAARDVYFVAVKPGDYDLECSIGTHSLFGMHGKIRISR